MRRALLLPLAACLAVACGSRTGLLDFVEGPTDAGDEEMIDTGLRDAGKDVASFDAPPEAPADAELPDVAPAPCTADSECSDGITCTVDHCDLATGTCTHDPDNALCPPGFACRPPCAAASFAESPDSLYGVDLPSGSVSIVGPTNVELDDIALDPHGTLYGIGAGSLYTVDTKTGAAAFVANVSGTFNALDFAPDGTLYGAGGDALFTIDPMTGHTKQVATYPAGYFSSGDLAIIGTQLLATVNMGSASTSDSLLSIDLTTFDATVIGSTGFPDIYGLAAYGALLFGYTATGDVLQIDPTTAKSTVLASPGVMFYGASAR